MISRCQKCGTTNTEVFLNDNDAESIVLSFQCTKCKQEWGQTYNWDGDYEKVEE